MFLRNPATCCRYVAVLPIFWTYPSIWQKLQNTAFARMQTWYRLSNYGEIHLFLSDSGAGSCGWRAGRALGRSRGRRHKDLHRSERAVRPGSACRPRRRAWAWIHRCLPRTSPSARLPSVGPLPLAGRNWPRPASAWVISSFRARAPARPKSAIFSFPGIGRDGTGQRQSLAQ